MRTTSLLKYSSHKNELNSMRTTSLLTYSYHKNESHSNYSTRHFMKIIRRYCIKLEVALLTSWLFLKDDIIVKSFVPKSFKRLQTNSQKNTNAYQKQILQSLHFKTLITVNIQTIKKISFTKFCTSKNSSASKNSSILKIHHLFLRKKK